MSINKDYIYDYLNDSDDLADSIIVSRLYTEYTKHKEDFDNELDYGLLEINVAKNLISENIMKKVDKNYNKKLIDAIKTNYLILSDCMANINLKNRKSKNKAIYYVTNLECLLNMPISFPEEIESCLAKKIGLEQEKGKRRLSR